MNITFKTLECKKPEDDRDDGDEVHLYFRTTNQPISKVTIWKGQMKKGDKKTLKAQSYATHVIGKIYLYDRDSGTIFDPDDKLGEKEIKKTLGEHVAKFQEDDADYRLTYEITN